jgi:hypothetical protein
MRLRFNGHPARRSLEHTLRYPAARYPAAGWRRASTCIVVSQSIVATSRTTHDDIAALDAPSDLSDDVDAMLTSFDAATDEAEPQGLAFFDTDDDPWADAGQRAGALGLDACAEG